MQNYKKIVDMAIAGILNHRVSSVDWLSSFWQLQCSSKIGPISIQFISIHVRQLERKKTKNKLMLAFGFKKSVDLLVRPETVVFFYFYFQFCFVSHWSFWKCLFLDWLIVYVFVNW